MAGTSVPHGVAVGVSSSWPWHAGPFLLSLSPFPAVGKALPASLQPPLWAHHHPCVSKGPVSLPALLPLHVEQGLVAGAFSRHHCPPGTPSPSSSLGAALGPGTLPGAWAPLL